MSNEHIALGTETTQRNRFSAHLIANTVFFLRLIPCFNQLCCFHFWPSQMPERKLQITSLDMFSLRPIHRFTCGGIDDEKPLAITSYHVKEVHFQPHSRTTWCLLWLMPIAIWLQSNRRIAIKVIFFRQIENRLRLKLSHEPCTPHKYLNCLHNSIFKMATF